MRNFLFLTVLGVLWTGFITEGRTQDFAQQANEAFAQGRYEEAVDTMKKFLASNPGPSKKAIANYVIGVSYFNLGKFKEAIEALKNTKEISPTQAPLAQFFLGSSYLSLKQIDPAIKTLEQILANKPKEGDTNAEAVNSVLKDLIPAVQFTIIQCRKAKADMAMENEQKDKASKMYKEVSQEIAKFLKENENTEYKQDALLMQVTANLVSKDFDTAWTTLQALKQEDTDGTLRENIRFLMGQTSLERGKAAKRNEKPQETKKHFNKARELFTELRDSPNLFYAAQAVINLGFLELDEKRFDKAFDIFKAVPTKEQIIVSQQKRIDKAKDLVTRYVSDPTRFKKAKRNYQQETKKLAQIEADQDPFMKAMLGVANAMLQLNKFDEARVLYRYFEPFMKDEQKKVSLSQIYYTYAMQGQTEKADKLYKELQAKYPKDENIERMSFLLPSSLMLQEKYDEAIKEFQKYIEDNPSGKLRAEAVLHIATCYMQLNKPQEAIKSYKQFISNSKDKGQLETASLNLAKAYWQIKEQDNAISEMEKLANSATTPAIKEDASFTIARFYSSMKQFDKAIEAYKAFAKNFPKSDNAPAALFEVGRQLAEQGKNDEAKFAEAKQYFEQLIKDYSGTDNAPRAYDRIWKMYQGKRDYENMFKVQDELMEKHPKSVHVLVVLKQRTDHHLKVDKDLNKAIKTLREMFAFYTKRKEEGSPLANPGQPAYSYGSYALMSIAAYLNKSATDMGPPGALSPEDLTKWNKRITEASDILWQAMNEFVGSSEGAKALSRWADIQLMRIQSGELKQGQVTEKLSRMIGSTDNPNLQVQYRLALARLAYELKQKKVSRDRYKEVFKAVSNPRAIPIKDYDRYLKILLDTKDFDQATKISDVLAESFAGDQRAQGDAVYYKAKIALAQGDTQKADAYFKELEEKYPKSAKNFDALYDKGLVQRKKGNYDEAFNLWSEVIKSSRSSNETKAEASLEMGKTLIEVHKKKAKTSFVKEGVNALEVAAKQLEKLAITMEQFTNICAEALYLASQCYDELGKGQKAQSLKSEIRQKYPNTPWASRS